MATDTNTTMTRLAEIQKTLDQVSRDIDFAERNRKELIEKLRMEHGLRDVEEAEKKIKTLEKEIVTQQKELEAGVKTLEELVARWT